MPFQAFRVLQACRRLAEGCEDELSLVGGVHSAANAPVVRAPDIGKQAPSGAIRIRRLSGLLAVDEAGNLLCCRTFRHEGLTVVRDEFFKADGGVSG